MFYLSHKLNFSQAVEFLHSEINSGVVQSTMDTEFGRIFWVIDNEQSNELYRYKTKPWNQAPINKTTKHSIRDTSIDHYMSMAKVNSYEIQKLMIVMAMTECILRYVTEDEDIIKHRGVNYLAGYYIRTHHMWSRYSSMHLANEYMDTHRRSVFAPKYGLNYKFVEAFFENIIKDQKRLDNKIEKWVNQYEVKPFLGDKFHEQLFKYVQTYYEIKIKEGSTYRARWIKVLENKDDIMTLPAVCRFVLSNRDI